MLRDSDRKSKHSASEKGTPKCQARSRKELISVKNVLLQKIMVSQFNVDTHHCY